MQRKLVFYSDQIVPDNRQVDQALIRLFSTTSPQIGYIPSAGDPEQRWLRAAQAYYRQSDLDLSLSFPLDNAYDPALLPQLLACDAIHLSGGNTYQFLAALHKRALVEPLRSYTAAGGILIGVSAGAILLTPTIHTAALCGDIPASDQADGTALGLVPFAFLPHSNHLPDVDAIIQAYLQHHRQPLIACPDGSGVIIDGATTTLIGSATYVPFSA